MLTAREVLLETVQSVLRRLPEDVRLRDLIEELEVMEEVEEGERDIAEGRILTLEELKKRTEPCLTK